VSTTEKAPSNGRCPVRNLAFCSCFTEDELSQLEQISRHVRIGKNELLFYEGEPAEYAYLLYQGCIKLSKDLPDGRCEIVDFKLPTGFLGLINSGQYAYTAEAVKESVVCRILRSDLQKLYRKNPEIEDKILNLVSEELNAAMSQMLLLGRMTAVEKLVTFLLTFAERCKRLGLSNSHINLPMGRHDIADYLGLTTESVSRIFSRLKEDGFVNLPTRHEIIIHDKEKLQNLLKMEESELKRYGKGKTPIEKLK